MLNIVFSAAFIVISIGLFISAQDIPGASKWDIIGSRLFPQIMVAGMGLCSLVLLIQSVHKHLRSGGNTAPVPVNKTVMVIFLALLAWVALINVLGFYSSAFVFLAFLHWFLNEKKVTPGVVVTPVVCLVGIYVIFGKFLRVILPEGLLM